MLSKGSILVVDDEINLCRILGAKLAKSGFSVVAVHDGQQAIDKVRETNFDVVLLDLILPKVDGLSALEEIRTFDRELPVIVMTACESSDALERARNHGVCAYVNKPFDLDGLVELVQTTSAGTLKKEERQARETSVLFAKCQPITLEILNGNTSGVFASRIESRDDRTISVLAPVCNGAVIQVSPRTPIRIGLATNDAYYSFNSYVLDLSLASNPVYILDKPGIIYRTQRRQSRRVAIDTEVRYAAIVSEESKPTSLLSARSYDLSTGGMKMATSDHLAPGDLVYLETDRAEGIGPIIAVAEVLRSNHQVEDDRYVVALKFRKMTGNLTGLIAD